MDFDIYMYAFFLFLFLAIDYIVILFIDIFAAIWSKNENGLIFMGNFMPIDKREKINKFIREFIRRTS